MPQRREIFVNGNYYHVFNRTIDNKIVFTNVLLNQFFLDSALFYRSSGVKISYSRYLSLTSAIQKNLLYEKMCSKSLFRINVLCYCLMPNHFHFLIKQTKTNGISSFMSNLVNSFTRYFNISNKRKGPLFLPRFQSRAIVTQEQLIHTSRYIHINHFVGGLVHNISEIDRYRWSSYPFYVTETKSDLVDSQYILKIFNNNCKKYRKFVEDYADFKKKQELVKYTKKWQ